MRNIRIFWQREVLTNEEKTLHGRADCSSPERSRNWWTNQLKDECLNMEVFRNVIESQVILGAWKKYYNEERPHSSLKYMTLAEFLKHWQENFLR